MRKLAIVASLALMLAACGGGASLQSNGGTSTGSSSSSSGGTSSSSGTSVGAASLTGIASSPTVASDGSTTSTITVFARNAANQLISGVVVSFSASGAGAVDVTQGTTGTNGEATAVLTALNAPVDIPITVSFSGGGHMGTVQVQVVSPQSTGSTTITPAALSVSSSAQSIPADGSSSATITAIASNSSNNVLAGVPVCFSTSTATATITPTNPNANGCVVTGASGTATATLTAVTGQAQAGTTVTVTATVGSLTPTVKVNIVATQTATTTPVQSLNVSASPSTILTDGSVSSVITALALDASNNVLSGVPISFATTSDDPATTGKNPTEVAGALQVTQPSVTGADGTLTAVLTTGGNSDQRDIFVTASTGSLSVPVKVVVAAPTTPVYALGNGSNSAFVSGAIGVGTTGQLAAGGTTGLTLDIVNTASNPANALYNANAVTVTFNSTCLASGQAQILPSGSTTPNLSVTTTTGSLGATYVAKGCSGTDMVTASAVVGGQAVSATATLTIAPATIGSIQFVSAAPTTIGLKGTGLGETSTVIFKVTDSTGGAEANVPVSFSLNTTVGGLSLTPTTATSASDGTVQTVVSSGTVHTVVRVTASIASPALSTQSSQLTVTTGLPASRAFSIAVGAPSGSYSSALACPNVEAFNIDGVSVPLTVRLADRYNNPVPDNTAIAFTTDGGHVVGSCTTPLSSPGDGSCRTTWTSANPRPGLDTTMTPPVTNLTFGYPTGYPPLLAAGRATVLATTIGEESFTDVNGSGFYQTGDPFSKLGDPWEDDNENGVYDEGEYFLDFNQTGVYAPTSGSFVGIICTGITAGSTCTTSTLAISESLLMIMSTSTAVITPDSSLLNNQTGFTALKNGNSLTGLEIGQGSTGTIVINVQDKNGNAMAAGTTVGWTFSNGAIGATLTAIAPTVVGCDSTTGGELFGASFTSGTGNGGSGIAYVTVTSPSGTETVASIPITIIPAPTVTLTATPTSVNSGASTVLAWTTANATSCTVPNWYSGSSIPLNGSTTVSNITQQTNYVLSCSGLGGTSIGQVTVGINP